MATEGDATRCAWRESLREALNALRSNEAPPRVAVVGVGNEMRSDDAVGVLVARQLLNRIPKIDSCLILEAGPMPESFGGPLRRFRPDLILFVDAVDMGELPGTVAWIDWSRIDGLSASTHTLPLSVVAHYYRADLTCRIEMVGIQIGGLRFGGGVCAEVRQAADDVAASLADEMGIDSGRSV